MGKFEKKAYTNIQITESIIGSVFKLLTKPMVKRMFKKMIEAEDDNFKASAKDMQYHWDEAKRAFDDFCKKYPKECK